MNATYAKVTTVDPTLDLHGSGYSFVLTVELPSGRPITIETSDLLDTDFVWASAIRRAGYLVHFAFEVEATPLAARRAWLAELDAAQWSPAPPLPDLNRTLEQLADDATARNAQIDSDLE